MALRAPTMVGQLAGVTASADISAYQYCNVKLDAATTCVYSGAGERAVGVLLNEPESGEAADIMLVGVCMMVVDGNAGAISIGSYLESDAAGKGVATTTDTDELVGMALAASTAAGDIIPVVLMHGTLAG